MHAIFEPKLFQNDGGLPAIRRRSRIKIYHVNVASLSPLASSKYAASRCPRKVKDRGDSRGTCWLRRRPKKGFRQQRNWERRIRQRQSLRRYWLSVVP